MKEVIKEIEVVIPWKKSTSIKRKIIEIRGKRNIALIEEPLHLKLINYGFGLHYNYRLACDIDMKCTSKRTYNKGRGFDPIGGICAFYRGTFDGNGHTISNLYINQKKSGVGLFGYASVLANIKNLTLKDVDITGYNHVGGVVGVCGANLVNVHTTGNVQGNEEVDGLIGRMERELILTECSSTCCITKNVWGE
jgi:hypothetical protein